MAGITEGLKQAKQGVQHAAERAAFSLIAEKLAKELHGNPNKTETYLKILDQAAARGIIHKNKAAHKKSQFTLLLNKM